MITRFQTLLSTDFNCKLRHYTMEMGMHTVMLTLLSRYGPQYVFLMTTWHVWFAITCLSLSPWFFHPQSFKEGMVWQGFVEWA